MSWTIDPELALGDSSDSDSDSDGLAFDYDAAADDVRRNQMDTLNSFLLSSPEKGHTTKDSEAPPSRKKKRRLSFESSDLGSQVNVSEGSTSESPKKKRRKVLSHVPVNQRREISEYNHLLSTLRTEATADISSQMLNYLGIQGQTVCGSSTVDPRSDVLAEIGSSQIAVRGAAPRKTKLSGTMDRKTMWPLQSSDLQIPRFGLEEEVSRIAQEFLRRQHNSFDSDIDFPESLMRALSRRSAALLEHLLDLLYQRRDAVAPSVQIRLRPAGWESLLGAVGTTGAVNPVVLERCQKRLETMFGPGERTSAAYALTFARAKPSPYLPATEASISIPTDPIPSPSHPTRTSYPIAGESDQEDEDEHEDDYFAHLDEDLVVLEYSKTAKSVNPPTRTQPKKARGQQPKTVGAGAAVVELAPIPTSAGTAGLATSIIQVLMGTAESSADGGGSNGDGSEAGDEGDQLSTGHPDAREDSDDGELKEPKIIPRGDPNVLGGGDQTHESGGEVAMIESDDESETEDSEEEEDDDFE
ncbi:hypothetical protein FRB95_011271 [Tulasnella sp. JGI-2019a]|nr:hypothetical protein FRB95_011271 [Tulasnella sp. JGI-2019a]